MIRRLGAVCAGFLNMAHEDAMCVAVGAPFVVKNFGITPRRTELRTGNRVRLEATKGSGGQIRNTAPTAPTGAGVGVVLAKMLMLLRCGQRPGISADLSVLPPCCLSGKQAAGKGLERIAQRHPLLIRKRAAMRRFSNSIRAPTAARVLQTL